MDSDNDSDIEKQYEPMGDDDIQYYFPNSKILTIKELSKYNNINQLLTEPDDHAFLLYQSSPNMGHWVLLVRYNGITEYFDSYGGYIDHPYLWIPKERRVKLGEGKAYLSNLLVDVPDLIYNGFDFQNKKDLNISTCGRHACNRLMKIINDDMSLEGYIKWMKRLKKLNNLSFDEIVSILIDK
jgi:hypothetical protein